MIYLLNRTGVYASVLCEFIVDDVTFFLENLKNIFYPKQSTADIFIPPFLDSKS